MPYAFNNDKSKFSLDPIEEDVAGAIESIAPVESVVATENHAVGDYFMLGNTLMVATSAIATGETINSSNATLATVQAQIDDLKNSLMTDGIRHGSNQRYVTFTSSESNTHYGTIFIISSSNALVALVIVDGTSCTTHVIYSKNSFTPTITNTSTSTRIDLGSQWAHSAFVLGGSMTEATMSIANS